MRSVRRLTVLAVLVSVFFCLSGCLNEHTVYTPSVPSGPSSVNVGQSAGFSTSGSECSRGHEIQYRFDWGDGSYSSWSYHSSANKSWTNAGTYHVRAQARCSSDTTVTSGWSSARTVTVTAATPTVPPTQKLEILDWQLLPYDNQFMPWVIRGHAKNVSGRTLEYAEVRGQFYDVNDVLLASWLDNVNGLGAGIVWEFNIYCIQSDIAGRVHHATVTVGTCF